MGSSPAAPDQLTTVRASKLIGGGRTLAHTGGATWMLRGGLPGELLAVHETRRRARVVEADVIELLEDPHPARIETPCPHAGLCGGCDWPHVEPRAGSELKVTVAAEAAARFPEIEARLREAPVTPSPPSYRLRNRLHWDPKNRVLGFYAHRSWEVAEITHCRIVSSSLAEQVPHLQSALVDHCPHPVDLEVLEGSDSIIAALRPARRGPKSIPRDWVPPSSACPGIGGFHRLGKGLRLLRGWGREVVHMDLPVPLEVPVGSFFQGNRHLVPELFERTAGLIGPGDDPVFDLHGGVGFLAAAAHSAGRSRLTVVEIHPGAAAAARRNLPDARVSPTSAEAFLEDHCGLPQRSVAITDPPRSGLTPGLRNRLADWRPDRIVTLGCDPATWSRDVADLMAAGYSLTHLELFDLFPFTHHVEVLAAMEAT